MAVSSTLDPIEKVFYREGIHETDPRAAPLKGLRPLRGPRARSNSPARSESNSILGAIGHCHHETSILSEYSGPFKSLDLAM